MSDGIVSQFYAIFIISYFIRYREIELHDSQDLPADIKGIICDIKSKIENLYGESLEFLPSTHVIDLASDGFIGKLSVYILLLF